MACTCVKARAKSTPFRFQSINIPSSLPWRSNGRHWKEVSVNPAALVIEKQPTSRNIQLHGASTSQVGLLKSTTSSQLDTKWLVLQPTELLVRIDLCLASGQHRGLRGVRFATTMRESMWYNDCVGSGIESLEAPEGFFINGVFASQLDDHVVQLGVRFEPRNRQEFGRVRRGNDASCPQLCLPRELELTSGKRRTVSRYDLRAISLEWSRTTTSSSSSASTQLKGVTILSCDVYDQALAANCNGQGQATMKEHEDMLVLTVVGDETEAVTKVEVAYERDQVAAVRFTTTRGRLWPWMGQYNQRSQRVVSHDVPVADGSAFKLTGFSFAYERLASGSKRIVRLDPVFHPIA